MVGIAILLKNSKIYVIKTMYQNTLLKIICNGIIKNKNLNIYFTLCIIFVSHLVT